MVVLLAVALAGCGRPRYAPHRASPAYPMSLHDALNVADIQVFREGTSIEIVNSTPETYRDCYLWINQRYRAPLAELPAGETVKVSLWDFYDVRGEVFGAGGLLRTEPAEPVRLVQIQVAEDQPLLGLITIVPKED